MLNDNEPVEKIPLSALNQYAYCPRRCYLIHAEGEFNAAQKLVDAAALLATEPITIQLRYLQTLTEIGVEKNTTIVFPLPIEMMQLFSKMGDSAKAALEKK